MQKNSFVIQIGKFKIRFFEKSFCSGVSISEIKPKSKKGKK